MSDFPQAGLDAGREALRRFLAGDDDLAAMQTKIALIATETVPGCDMASITMLRDQKPTTPAFTAKSALLLDEVQYSLGDGPCLAAIRHRGAEHVSTPPTIAGRRSRPQPPIRASSPSSPSPWEK